MNNWLYLVFAILAEVAATSSLKASEGFSRLWPSVLVVAGYSVSFYCLSMTLRTIPIGIAYAIWSGVGITLIGVIGWLFYGQRIDAAGIAGMTLIAIGVIVINTLSSSVSH